MCLSGCDASGLCRPISLFEFFVCLFCSEDQQPQILYPHLVLNLFQLADVRVMCACMRRACMRVRARVCARVLVCVCVLCNVCMRVCVTSVHVCRVM